MRVFLSVYLSFCMVCVAPVAAASLSKQEKTAYSCVLTKAREGGKPDVAAYDAAEECPMRGLTEAQKKRVIDMTIRRLMEEYGMTCLGAGCD